jgi:hypothetical protein
MDRPIQYFGYKKDPRIEELRRSRNSDEDLLRIFERDQIARKPDEVNPRTRIYIGDLVPGIFKKLADVEYIYISFPEGKIRRQQVEIGGKTKEQLQSELKQAGVNVSSYAEDMMNSPDLTTLPIPQALDTVRLKVGDLGLSGYPTTDQVYRKAQELGLDLCPAEVGPRLRLQYTDQPMGEWVYVGMEQINDLNGNPNVFGLERHVDGLWLDGIWALPDDGWSPNNEFVFCLRKSETQNP